VGKLSNNSTKKNLNGAACAIQGSVAKYHSKHFILPTLLDLELQYNMYHKHSLDAQNAQPIHLPEGRRSERPKAGSRPPQGMGIAGPFWRALLSHRRGHNGL
jgi:hypothetical protein